MLLGDVVSILTIDVTAEYATINESIASVKEIERKLHDLLIEYPQVRQLILPVYQWLASHTPPVSTEDVVLSPSVSGDEVVEATLVTVQSLLGLQPAISAQIDEEQAPDDYIKGGWNLMSKLSRSLNLAAISEKGSGLLKSLVDCPTDEVDVNVRRVLPFLQNYVVLADAQVAVLAHWTKSLLKLDHILCSTVYSLAKDGFCQPQETQDGGDGAEGGDAMEGTGLGEGTGAENVSKEIQDESQVEGLQGESGDNDDDVERADEDNAIEMADDIGGKMQDVPEGEDAGEEEEGNDDDSEVDPDDQIGELDANDETAVDEKLWGDEKGPEGRDEDTKRSDQDNSTQQTDGQDDVVAKDGQQDKKSKKEQEQQPTDVSDEKPHEDPSDEPTPEDQMEDEGQEDAGETGVPLDDYVQNAETLDLPDDIDMDPGKEEPQEEVEADDEDEDDTMNGIEELEDGDPARNPPDQVEEDNLDQAKDDDDAVPGESAEEGSEEPDRDAAQPDTSTGEGGGEGLTTNAESQETEASPTERDEAQGQAGGSSRDKPSTDAEKR